MRRPVTTTTDTVLAEVADGVGIITLNRPERRNALHPQMYDAIPDILEQFLDDPEVGAILVTGSGTAFCAGGDVRDGRRRTSDGDEPSLAERAESLTHSARMVEMLHGSPKVTIAALPGPAVGAGMSIALSTDLRIAAESAKLVPGWGRLAFSGDFGGTWFLARRIGSSRALEFLIEGAAMEAPEAHRLGLFNRVVPDGDLPSAAFDWAAQIAAGPRGAWSSMKENLTDAMELSLARSLPREAERMVRSGTSEEHRAAVRAWLAEAAERGRERASNDE